MTQAFRLQRHERLMNRMADQNGAELGLAEQVGLLTPEEYGEALLACTGCSAVASCEAHLDGGSEGVPEFCRNKSTIRRLAVEMADLGLTEI